MAVAGETASSSMFQMSSSSLGTALSNLAHDWIAAGHPVQVDVDEFAMCQARDCVWTRNEHGHDIATLYSQPASAISHAVNQATSGTTTSVHVTERAVIVSFGSGRDRPCFRSDLTPEMMAFLRGFDTSADGYPTFTSTLRFVPCEWSVLNAEEVWIRRQCKAQEFPLSPRYRNSGVPGHVSGRGSS